MMLEFELLATCRSMAVVQGGQLSELLVIVRSLILMHRDYPEASLPLGFCVTVPSHGRNDGAHCQRAPAAVPRSLAGPSLQSKTAPKFFAAFALVLQTRYANASSQVSRRRRALCRPGPLKYRPETGYLYQHRIPGAPNVLSDHERD